MKIQHYIRKANNGDHVEPFVFSLPFSYGDYSFGAETSFEVLKEAGFIKYIPATLEIPAMKALDYIEYVEVNENEATLKAHIRELTEQELEVYFEDATDLDTLKKYYIRAFNAMANNVYQDYLAKYPGLEQSTFSQKANEAFKVEENNDIALSETPFISILANKDKAVRNELAKAIMNKINYITNFERFCVEKRDEIEAISNRNNLFKIKIDLSDFKQ